MSWTCYLLLSVIKLVHLRILVLYGTHLGFMPLGMLYGILLYVMLYNITLFNMLYNITLLGML